MPGRRGDRRPPRDDYPSEAYERGRRRGGHAEPGLPPDPFEEDEEPPRRRRGRRRGADEESDYAAASAAPAASRHASGGGDDFPPQGRASRRRGGNGGGRSGLGIGGWISVVLTCVMVIGTLTAYKVYRSTIGMFNVGKSTDDLDKNRPVNATGAINVLLVGSDSRAGANKKYGQHLVNDGERTDTIMLLHVSPNRDGATLISFPRDSMVMIPNCYDKNRRLIPAHLGMINSAFSEGGMICTRRTIETLTGIRVHHYVKVDFTGFKNIVNALGGIEICLPQPVDDKKSKLHLPAGKQIVKGEEALGYVRLRYGLGDGSDISRIKRQQVFLSQVVKKATSTALLTDLGKLQNFIAATAKSVTMDDALNTEELIKIAQSASKLSAKGFKATTVPWEPYTADRNRVQWKQPDANNLFRAIANDTVATPSASPTPATSASPSGPVVTKPQQVKVQVFNGTNTSGLAKQVAEDLSKLGFKVVGVGDAKRPDGTDQPKTMVRYTGQGWNYAKILVGKLVNPVSPETGKVASGPVTPFTPASPPTDAPKGKVRGPIIQLVIGADWKGVRAPIDLGDNAVTADTNPCTS
ncbi:MAG: LCP family protein [Microbispora sp.]|nr:LCP family protein [Microbispora sp.]